jgi:hypothetical protein
MSPELMCDPNTIEETLDNETAGEWPSNVAGSLADKPVHKFR